MKSCGILKDESGQFSIEYLISFILFASVLIFLSFQIASTIPGLYTESQSNKLSSNTMAITDSLIRSTGNWTGDVDYGLATEPNLLDPNKVENFNKSCTRNYTDVRNSFGLSNTTDFNVRLESSDGTNLYIDCTDRRMPSGVQVERVERYTVIEDNIARLVFEIW